MSRAERILQMSLAANRQIESRAGCKASVINDRAKQIQLSQLRSTATSIGTLKSTHISNRDGVTEEANFNKSLDIGKQLMFFFIYKIQEIQINMSNTIIV